MEREQAIGAFVATVREKAAATEYVGNQLQRHLAQGDQVAFGAYCMSIARKLLDRPMPDGSVHDAVVQLWQEMGGGAPSRSFPEHGPPVLG